MEDTCVVTTNMEPMPEPTIAELHTKTHTALVEARFTLDALRGKVFGLGAPSDPPVEPDSYISAAKATLGLAEQIMKMTHEIADRFGI